MKSLNIKINLMFNIDKEIINYIILYYVIKCFIEVEKIEYVKMNFFFYFRG